MEIPIGIQSVHNSKMPGWIQFWSGKRFPTKQPKQYHVPSSTVPNETTVMYIGNGTSHRKRHARHQIKRGHCQGTWHCTIFYVDHWGVVSTKYLLGYLTITPFSFQNCCQPAILLFFAWLPQAVFSIFHYCIHNDVLVFTDQERHNDVAVNTFENV